MDNGTKVKGDKMTGVKKVERFQTSNGRLFEDLAKAEEHELIDSWANDVLDSLGGRDLGCNFTNGEGIIQISADRYTSAEVLYGDILGRLYGSREVHGRRISDDNERPPSVWAAYSAFDCVTKRDDGWYERVGQPYYKLNPSRMDSREVLKKLV